MKPLELIDSLYEAFGRGDLGYILSKVAPDVTWKGPSTVPWGGTHTGPEGVQAFFAALGGNLEITGMQVRQRITQGDSVVYAGSFEGRGRKSGKTAASDFCWVWHVKDGLVSSYEGHFDTAAVVAALT